MLVGLMSSLVPAVSSAGEARSSSILVLDQSDMRGNFYHQILTSLQNEVGSDPGPRVTVYAEDLDLEHFSGTEYEAKLQQLLRTKYQAKQVGVLLPIGASALCFALRWRDKLWPGVPIVFALVGEQDFRSLSPPSDVTGNIVKLRLADAVTAARAVVPDLASIYIVGDRWDDQIVFRHWREEISSVPGDLRVVQLIGLPMTDLRERLSELPERSAIIHTETHSDGKGNFFRSAAAVSLISEKANRPMVVGSETLLSSGGIGGYVLLPNVIGREAGRLALRILHGAQPADLPPKPIAAVAPIFNWEQMRRWNVAAESLPAGSEIRFRNPSFWERYAWQSLAVLAVILIQGALISILLHERRRRGSAELESRDRLSELAHVGRRATAGELSSSIAHELNQPLGAILSNAETAELILKSPSPDVTELKEILADIRRDDLRASEIIHRMRSLLKRAPFELKNVDLNVVAREAFEFLTAQAASRNVALYFKAFPEGLPIKGDAVQLQQVILNLVVNSIEAMSAMPFGRAVIGRTELNGEKSAVVSISDSGPGIPSEKLAEIFDPFFTTKELGMGIGLSIARTIVQAHKGRIWAENLPGGGAVFRLSVPLVLH